MIPSILPQHSLLVRMTDTWLFRERKDLHVEATDRPNYALTAVLDVRIDLISGLMSTSIIILQLSL